MLHLGSIACEEVSWRFMMAVLWTSRIAVKVSIELLLHLQSFILLIFLF